MTEEKKLEFKNIGINDHIPYTKVDLAKSCRISENFAFSFYQMDYQALAASLTNQSELKANEIGLIPVAKIVLNHESFLQLRNEINTLHDLFLKEQSLGDLKK
ncbi:MAG: hypothetical protein A2Y33_14375 [Spirochaetes bacterium GWF1_51_8]|nr:MAG: hypothetical protein A2Y33_14375 [Spirochaetes bacterium GWF1_51_8]